MKILLDIILVTAGFCGLFGWLAFDYAWGMISPFSIDRFSGKRKNIFKRVVETFKLLNNL